MFVPKVRDRVLVGDGLEVFVVAHVDVREGWADLACVERVGFLPHVPLEKLRPVKNSRRRKGARNLGEGAA